MGQLALKKIEELVKDSVVGTLVCFDGKNKRDFPIIFVCDRNYIYSFSRELDKIELMRKDPAVLIKLFKDKNTRGWSSINIIGIYEELKDMDAEIARCVIRDKLILTIENDDSIQIPGMSIDDIYQNLEDSLVIYRINMLKKSGKAQLI